MARLRECFGDAVGAYTDLAALFLLLAAELVSRDGGRACLIEPISVLSARHEREHSRAAETRFDGVRLLHGLRRQWGTRETQADRPRPV